MVAKLEQQLYDLIDAAILRLKKSKGRGWERELEDLKSVLIEQHLQKVLYENKNTR